MPIFIGLSLACLAGWTSTSLPDQPEFSVAGGSKVVLSPSPIAGHERQTWTIHNSGLTALKLRTHFTSGRAGFSLWLGQEYWIPSGEDYSVSLAWTTPGLKSCSFSRHAEVWTSDPGRPKLKFEILGKTIDVP